LFQNKENSINIKVRFKRVKLLAFLTSLVLHTSRLNLQAIGEDGKEREVSEELLGVAPPMDMLSPLKKILDKLIQGCTFANMSNNC
jgi:hypothetical protein